MSILVVGSVALDTIKTPFGKEKEILGGSATYFSLSARFFSPVNLVAVAGTDFPRKYVNFLKNRKVDLKGLTFEEGKTFRWQGRYGWDFGNPETVATHLNVFSTFNPKIPPSYRKSKYLFLANIDPVLQHRVLSQIDKPRLIACDTMNYWIEKKRKELLRLVKKVDIFFLNESEAKELTGQASLIRAAKALCSLGAKKIIIKKGEHGSLLFLGDSVFSTPAYMMESIVDPTGAGDTFAGGVMGYLSLCKRLNEANFRKAIVYGSVMATFAVENFSVGRLGYISKSDIERRYRKYEKLTRF